MKQQDLNNMRLIKDLRRKGIDRRNSDAVDSQEASEENSFSNPTGLPSLRQTLLAVKRAKQPHTRLAENSLQARAEDLRIRIMLLKKERDKRKRCIDNLRAEYQDLMFNIEEKTSRQMHSYHNLSKEKAVFDTWQEQFKMDKVTKDFWNSALRQERLFIIHQLSQIFPIGKNIRIPLVIFLKVMIYRRPRRQKANIEVDHFASYERDSRELQR